MVVFSFVHGENLDLCDGASEPTECGDGKHNLLKDKESNKLDLVDARKHLCFE